MGHDPRVFIGLGNPGRKYSHNRHNVGQMALQAIAKSYQFPEFTKAPGGLATKAKIDGQLVWLFLPASYMNLSGEAVQAFAHFHKFEPAQLCAVHDDLDLMLGKLRVKLGGGHGGHNGLRSMDAHLTRDYHRLRIGIGHPGDKNLVSDYVLSDFTGAEKKTVETIIAAIADNFPLLLQNDSGKFLNQVHTAVI